ncbi:MAG TPA: hypothetical protein VG759_08570 [Candidatus Angelobacter sp.]|nr:hypothetical protein [Candidatus Angelobacter sp.]
MPKDYEYWVYIMASASGTLYVGMTNNLGGESGSIRPAILRASPSVITVTGLSIMRAMIGFIELLAVKSN